MFSSDNPKVSVETLSNTDSDLSDDCMILYVMSIWTGCNSHYMVLGAMVKVNVVTLLICTSMKPFSSIFIMNG